MSGGTSQRPFASQGVGGDDDDDDEIPNIIWVTRTNLKDSDFRIFQ